MRRPAAYNGAVNALSTTLEPHAATLRGGRRPFAEVAQAELDAVFRYLVFLTGDRTVAEDLTGETFEKALRSWRRFDPRRAGPRTWLCRIARNVALDWFRAEERRRRREETYERSRPESAEAVFAEGFSAPLEAALSALSAAEREVVALRVVLELDGPSAARILGVSETACSTRLSRALKRLEERMSDVDG
jgi:RNA polymerase sigma-70 factor (ECF subfamily)